MNSNAGPNPLRHWPFILFLGLYSALLGWQLGYGLESLDAHGIIDATRALIANHEIEVSRPPGHPTTEFYLFGAVAWILGYGFGREFDDTSYLVLQGIAALATLGIFYALLCRIGTKIWRAFLATICLGFTAQFFPNATGGEEFIFALFFVLLAIWLLVDEPDAPVKRVRWLLSIFCFALATGCRLEVVVAGLIYPAYCLFHPKRDWKKCSLASLPAGAAAILLVWLPILLKGVKPLYGSGMDLRESILGGGYKLLFQCFTLPVFLLLCCIMFVALRNWREQLRQPFPRNFIFVISCLIPLVFTPVFVGYAAKPAYIFVAVPFLLLLAAESAKGWLLGLTALTFVGCFVTVDIFHDRRLAGPLLVPGTCLHAIRQKPFYKLDYLRRLLSECGEAPSVIIADAWRWDFDYHIARGNLSLVRKELVDTKRHDMVAFFPGSDGCIILPRHGFLQSDLLETWQAGGYILKMDAAVYRTFFARYDVLSPSLGNSARVGPLSFRLFLLKSSSSENSENR